MTRSRHRTRRPVRLSTRLLLAQALLLLVGAGTAWLVAAALGPSIFHQHLMEAGGGHTAAELDHIERGFRDSLLVALGTGLLAAVLVALAVTAWFSRRLQRSLAAVARSARAIRDGHYETRVGGPDGSGLWGVSGMGPDFAHLTGTVDELATRLGDVERTRTRLLSDLAHEMRTPLTSIEAHLEAIDDGIRAADTDTLAVIRDSTRRLRRLAEDLSAVSRAEEGRTELRPAPCRIDELVRTAVTAASETFRARSVDLRTGPLTNTTVVVDRDRMMQVLANLLQNALNHCAAGDTVTLSATPDPDGARPGDSVRLEVRDTGAGIAAGDLPHLFERFYRADPARTHRDPALRIGAGNGSGIGLTISQAIVEAHHGSLRAASDGPGRGATFTVGLPAARSTRPTRPTDGA